MISYSCMSNMVGKQYKRLIDKISRFFLFKQQKKKLQTI